MSVLVAISTRVADVGRFEAKTPVVSERIGVYELG